MSDSQETTEKGSMMVAVVYATVLLAMIPIGLWAGRVKYGKDIKFRGKS